MGGKASKEDKGSGIASSGVAAPGNSAALKAASANPEKRVSTSGSSSGKVRIAVTSPPSRSSVGPTGSPTAAVPPASAHASNGGRIGAANRSPNVSGAAAAVSVSTTPAGYPSRTASGPTSSASGQTPVLAATGSGARTLGKLTGKGSNVDEFFSNGVVEQITKVLPMFSDAVTNNGTVKSLVNFVSTKVPAIMSTLGILGERAPLIGVVFSVLKVAGSHLAATNETSAAYKAMADAVVQTTRLIVQVEEMQASHNVGLPPPVNAALNSFWDQLDAFADLFVKFRGKHYASQLLTQGDNASKLKQIGEGISRAYSDLMLASALVTNVQLVRVVEFSQDSLAIQRETSANVAHVAQLVGQLQTATVVVHGRGTWAIAPNVASFVGRTAELAAVTLQPAPEKEPARRVVVTGVFGMGRRSLAFQAAQLSATKFTSGWTLDGTSVVTIGTGMIAMARNLGLGDLTPEAAVSAIRSKLSEKDYAGWLVVVLNVNNPTTRDTLVDMLPHVGGCLLLTSQLADWDSSRWAVIALSAMTAAEGVQILTNDATVPAGAATDAETLKAIVAKLGGLPLALQNARTAKERMRVNWVSYMSVLQKSNGASDVLKTTLDALVAAYPHTETMMQLLQVLHGNGIQRTFLVDLYRTCNTGAGQTQSDGDQALGDMAVYSVITLTEETVELNDLMQKAMQTRRACPDKVAADIDRVMTGLVDAEYQNNFQLMGQLLAHYESLIAWYEQRLLSLHGGGGGAGEARNVRGQLADTLVTCGRIYAYSFGNPATAQALLKRGRDIKQEIYGANSVEVAGTLNFLGDALRAGGDVKAAQGVLDQALAIHRKHATGFHNAQVAFSLCSLASCYLYDDDVLAGAAAAGAGPSESQTAKTKALHEAKRMLKEALEIMKSIHGAKDHRVAATLVSLGTAYGKLGELAKQKLCLQQALEITEKAGDPVKVAVTLGYLADVEGALGNFAEKAALLERAVNIWETCGGSHYADASGAIKSLLNTYGAVGANDAKKKELIERGMGILGRQYSTDREKAIQTFQQFTETLSDGAKAKALFDKAQAAVEQRVGQEISSAKKALVSLSNLMLASRSSSAGLVSAGESTPPT